MEKIVEVELEWKEFHFEVLLPLIFFPFKHLKTLCAQFWTHSSPSQKEDTFGVLKHRRKQTNTYRLKGRFDLCCLEHLKLLESLHIKFLEYRMKARYAIRNTRYVSSFLTRKAKAKISSSKCEKSKANIEISKSRRSYICFASTFPSRKAILK